MFNYLQMKACLFSSFSNDSTHKTNSSKKLLKDYVKQSV